MPGIYWCLWLHLLSNHSRVQSEFYLRGNAPAPRQSDEPWQWAVIISHTTALFSPGNVTSHSEWYDDKIYEKWSTVCVWEQPLRLSRLQSAKKWDRGFRLCVLVTVEILLHQPPHKPAKSVLGDGRKWFSWCGFPGESVWKLLLLVLTVERRVCFV